MSLELLEYLVTWSRVAEVSMGKFEGNDSSKKNGSLLCAGGFVLKCLLANLLNNKLKYL